MAGMWPSCCTGGTPRWCRAWCCAPPRATPAGRWPSSWPLLRRLHRRADRNREAWRVAASRVGEAFPVDPHHLHLKALLDLCDRGTGVDARVVARNTLDLETLRLQPCGQCVSVCLLRAVSAELCGRHGLTPGHLRFEVGLDLLRQGEREVQRHLLVLMFAGRRLDHQPVRRRPRLNGNRNHTVVKNLALDHKCPPLSVECTVRVYLTVLHSLNRLCAIPVRLAADPGNPPMPSR